MATKKKTFTRKVQKPAKKATAAKVPDPEIVLPTEQPEERPVEQPTEKPEEPQEQPTEQNEPETAAASEVPEVLDSTPITSTPQSAPIEETKESEESPLEKEFWGEEKNKDNAGGSFKKILLYLLVFTLFAGLFAVTGYFSYKFGFDKGFSEGEKSSEKRQALQPTPTPTPKEEADLSEFLIEILNGSGKNGEASKLKTSLEDEGYTVSTIGNAGKTYEKTVIQAKDSVSKAFLSKLKKSLGKIYILDDEVLPLEEGKSDLTVTIGSSTE